MTPDPLSWNEWHLTLLSPWGWPGRVMAFLSALLVLILAWRALRRDTRPRRYVLLSLRALGLAAALTLFLQPALQLRNVTRLPNHVAVLVDASESMSLAERAGEPSRAERAAQLLRREQKVLQRWRQKHHIDFYTFGDRLMPATQEALLRPGGATSRADATRIREALAALRQRYEGRDLAGVVLLSDGLDNGRLSAGQRERQGTVSAERADPNEPVQLDGDTRDFLRALDAPIHTVAVGRPGLHDVAVARILADEFAFARTAAQVEARILVLGADEAGWVGRRLPVTLRRDGQPLLTVDVEVHKGQRDYRVLFPFTPERVGTYVYEVSTPTVPGEAIAENNRRAFVLRVIRDKIRVVHVAGRPSWDVRFLRGLLKHDPNIDLVSFFILRSPSDIDLGPSSETSLIPFPCEELFQQQLRSFDLVILHNFNYNAYCAQYLQPSIVPFVQEGGALAMIGGELSFSSGGYYGSAVAQVLPVELLPETMAPSPIGGPAAPRDRLVNIESFRPRLTPEGRSHPLTALQLEVRENERRWQELPMLEGVNLVARLKPGAQALLSHPFVKDADGRPLPVLSVMEVGKGRTMALLADSTWRWGFGATEEGGGDARGTAYQRFYEQAIRWLIRDPSLRLLRVETSESEYGREQPVRIVVRALGPDYRPAMRTEVAVAVSRIGDQAWEAPKPVLNRTLRTGEEGDAHLEIGPLSPGGYRITARATLGGRLTEEIEVFIVRGAGRELESPEADPRYLVALSQATSGRALGPDDSLDGLWFHEPHVVRINRHQDVEIWSRSWVLVVAVVCFGLNWTLRRRWGYA
ncbi:MAG: hypothetical protein RMK29_13170 [Myxococcales bacterium]|nr:hypothetical protein [Myxococcota bacterium]MDW8282657.1 hypothetical protein [Myxococcales bacterium]